MKKYHLIWDENVHKVGIASIDGQHRELIERVNLIADAVAHGAKTITIRSMMDDLILFTHMHFALEQRLMEEHGFPELQNHIEEHLELLQRMNNLYKLLGGSRQNKAELVTAFLSDWAELHILQADKVLGNFLVSKGLS
ncbi:MAG TPA: bacteriohemerythrin [Sulfuricella sp.]|nr:bacteriohemerythrin [Sulfuricella sp.]